ncbi:MAG: hypothetical protein R2681_05785 [Pyrinomonadaceae bacterium]
MELTLYKTLLGRFLWAALFSILVLLSSCTASRTDMRSLVSTDTLVYFESNDLSQVLKLITENEKFRKDTAVVPDLSALEGLQIAISVTGFDTSENQVTEEQSILNLRPKFVAVAETNGWSWHVEALVDGALSNFIRRVYGGDVKVDRESKTGSEWYIWTANDGRRSFAAAVGSKVYFGNDRGSIEKAISASRGESGSLLENKHLESAYAKSRDKLAFGFVSEEGIKKISDVFGISVAVEQTEDENSRGFISRILPQILNNSIKELVWTAEKTENGVEDTIFIKTSPEASAILSETIATRGAGKNEPYDLLPAETKSVTRYDLRNPQVAFRSILLVTAKSVSETDARLISAFSGALLEPYGISKAEEFLSGVDSQIITAQLDDVGDNSLAIVEIKDREKVRSAVSKELDLSGDARKVGNADLWQSEDEDLAAAELGRIFVLGNIDAVFKAIASWNRRKISPQDSAHDFTKGRLFGMLAKSNAAAATFGRGNEDVGRLVRVLGEPKDQREQSFSNTLVETRFTASGIERRSVSDFGFIGTIITQFDGQ